MILKNGVYYDYTGVVDAAAIQKWLKPSHPGAQMMVRTARMDYFEAYEDDFLDDEQYKFLFKVLRQLRKKKTA